MPVPFQDLRNEDDLGWAAYLRFVSEEDGRGIRGALFLVNARGEPVEFAFSRIDVPASFLWRSGEARRHAVASLAVALFQACPKTPTILLALSEEVSPRLFTEDLSLDVPLCRVAEGENTPYAFGECIESLPNALYLVWSGQPPTEGSTPRRLLEALLGRQLITEPFERTLHGIDEAFRE